MDLTAEFVLRVYRFQFKDVIKKKQEIVIRKEKYVEIE